MPLTWKDNGVPVTNALRILESLIIDFEGQRTSLRRWYDVLDDELEKAHDQLPNPEKIDSLMGKLGKSVRYGTQHGMWILVCCLHQALNAKLEEIGMVFVNADVVPYQGGENGDPNK